MVCNSCPMLAHKASHQGPRGAEVIGGPQVDFLHWRSLPIAYTFPEVAWVGLDANRSEKNKILPSKPLFPLRVASVEPSRLAWLRAKPKTHLWWKTTTLFRRWHRWPHAGELLGGTDFSHRIRRPHWKTSLNDSMPIQALHWKRWLSGGNWVLGRLTDLAE